ncbi:DUF4350 domain-containing protein [Kibdelosporangium lantanae]
MTTSVSPDARRLWKAARGPVIVGAIVVIIAIMAALLSGSPGQGRLEPDSVTPDGSRAVARLLGSYGVDVERVDSVDTITGDATLLVTQPNWVDPQHLAAITRAAGHTVLVGANSRALGAVTTKASVYGERAQDVRQPGCPLAAAQAAGNVRMGGLEYTTSGGTACYQGLLVQVEDKVTLLGDGTPLTNESLGAEGNAALALRLLGQHRKLVWYVPALPTGADSGEKKSFFDLVPPGWLYGLVMSAVAVVLLMLWRGRRLGRVVVEPLPVVVRAAETAEGRARLYRRARAVDHAANELRRATVRRLLPMLGLTAEVTGAAVVEQVAERTGRSGAEVQAVLYGPPPVTEQALVQLADALDELTNEVRTR